jgi:hypothetical protein
MAKKNFISKMDELAKKKRQLDVEHQKMMKQHHKELKQTVAKEDRIYEKAEALALANKIKAEKWAKKHPADAYHVGLASKEREGKKTKYKLYRWFFKTN